MSITKNITNTHGQCFNAMSLFLILHDLNVAVHFLSRCPYFGSLWEVIVCCKGTRLTDCRVISLVLIFSYFVSIF